MLIAIADLEQAVGRATAFRTRAGIGPVSRLSAADWLYLMDDGSDELRIAAALALQNNRPGDGLRRLLRPVTFDKARKRWSWSDTALVPGFLHRPLVDVLADALRRRVIDVQAAADPTALPEGASGKGLALAYRRAPVEASRVPLQRFVDEQLDDRRIERLLSALLLLDPAPVDFTADQAPDQAAPPPAIYALLAPFFLRNDFRPRWWSQDQRVRLLAETRWPALLVADATDRVADAALHRLSIAGLRPAVPLGAGRLIKATSPDGVRIAAALLCPLAPRDAAVMLETLCPEPIDATEGASA